MQPRTRAGIDFELSLQSDLWVKNEHKPKMVWDVVGTNVFNKMKNVERQINSQHIYPTRTMWCLFGW
jgi:hypothetical protein